MTKNSVRWYPGMLPQTGTEFFNHEQEDFVIENGQTKPFDQLSSYILRIILNAIDQDIKVSSALFELHPNCEMKRAKQFCRCRFGGLDFTPDVKDGELQQGEFWHCSLRGTCVYEGTLCKLPHYNGHQLTKHDVKLIQLLASPATNDAISAETELPPGTLHRDKNLLYKKLGNIQTKQEVAAIAFFLGLI